MTTSTIIGELRLKKRAYVPGLRALYLAAQEGRCTVLENKYDRSSRRFRANTSFFGAGTDQDERPPKRHPGQGERRANLTGHNSKVLYQLAEIRVLLVLVWITALSFVATLILYKLRFRRAFAIVSSLGLVSLALMAWVYFNL